MPLLAGNHVPSNSKDILLFLDSALLTQRRKIYLVGLITISRVKSLVFNVKNVLHCLTQQSLLSDAMLIMFIFRLIATLLCVVHTPGRECSIQLIGTA